MRFLGSLVQCKHTEPNKDVAFCEMLDVKYRYSVVWRQMHRNETHPMTVPNQTQIWQQHSIEVVFHQHTWLTHFMDLVGGLENGGGWVNGWYWKWCETLSLWFEWQRGPSWDPAGPTDMSSPDLSPPPTAHQLTPPMPTIEPAGTQGRMLVSLK